MRRAVLMLSGAVENYVYTKSLISPDDFIVCADGGYRHLKIMDITPDVWIGDNDSCCMNKEEQAVLENVCEIIRLNPIKDATDGEAACDYICKGGFDDVLILGFYGTRFDHVLCNVFLLKKFADCGIKAAAANETNIIYFACGHNEFECGNYKYVSVIPLSSSIENVSNSGLYYSLDNEALLRYSSRGVSNEPVADKFSIDIGSGDALIILSKD